MMIPNDIRHIYAVECAVLSTYLQSENYNITIGFPPNPKYFFDPVNQKIAKRIADTMRKGGSLDLLSFVLEEEARGTRYEPNFINIAAQTPLAAIEKHYDVIKRHAIKRRLDHE